jgi:hypothetical protein
LIAIDDRQHLVAAYGRIAAHVVVIDLNDERAVLHAAAQELCYVVGPIIQAIVGADDLQITVSRTGNAGIPWIARISWIGSAAIVRNFSISCLSIHTSTEPTRLPSRW